MLATLGNFLRNRKAKVQAALAIPPAAMDLRRPPRFAPALPYKMGAGGWPVEEPTQEEMEFFLGLLRKVPFEYFAPPGEDDYQYSASIRVRQWLELIAASGLLNRGKS